VPSVYSEPEAFGLTIVAEIDHDEPYSFDQVVVWRDRAGALWGAHDSGCSCPVPFEDVHYPAGMVEIRTLDDVRPLLAQQSDYNGPSSADVFDFLAKVRAAVRDA
jgi:hypothetical protein